ncbi:porin [Corallincola platygyrae]|uniref:Porin n=1 Tax=Corallincola platygyrae TaxID=1193278 RepID=A0ABW4XQ85_9GAMM
MRKVSLATATSFLLLPLSTSAIEIYTDNQASVGLGGYLQADFRQSGGDNEMTDQASRINFDFAFDAGEGWQALAKIEWGLNLVDSTSEMQFGQGGDTLTSEPKDQNDTVNLRLGYIGLSHDSYGTITFGKQWSVYYDVTERTDQMMVWGGEASGTFNYGSDGGISGTGRAEQAIVYRNSIGNLDYAFQYQAKNSEETNIYECQVNPDMDCGDDDVGDPISSFTYDKGYGAALTYHLPWNIDVGVGYNRSELDTTEGVNVAGFDGDYADALALGINYGQLSDQLYLAAVYYEGTNHEFDDRGEIFDSQGVELYGHYRLNRAWRIYVGYNQLKDNDNNYEGSYELKYYAVGASYQMSERVELFSESRIDDSTMADGSDADNIHSVGIRVML